jgi:hypothetical protein
MRPSSPQWIRDHLPECAIFVLGVFLRLTMLWRYKPEWGYDAGAHLQYVAWFTEHVSLPGTTAPFNHIAYHPPLYHFAAAALVKFGVQDVTWLSVVCGVVRLGLIWLGLEWYLGRRLARVAALTLAAVLPASVQIDGMVSNEAMNGMFGAAAMLLLPRALRAAGRRRWQLACALGLVFGLGALAKASSLVLLAGFGVGVLLDLLAPLKPFDRQTRLKALLPCAATVAICVAVAGWFYARNLERGHSPFATSYEINPSGMRHVAADTPLLNRRPPDFVYGWDSSVYQWPYYPSGLQPRARFFPVALASTFVDYYNHSFSGFPPDHARDLVANGRPMTARLVWLSRIAVLGGTVILLATLAAWTVCLLRTSQRREWGLFAALLAPLLATFVALYFAVKYPYDVQGVVKGVYMQFGAPPLYAMFGVAVAWLWADRRRRLAVGALLLSLGAVAAYTVCCRTGLFA